MYIVVVVVLFIAGLQVPVMPFLDVVGRADNVAPEQYGATAVNVGVTFGLTVMVIVAVVAHRSGCRSEGIKWLLWYYLSQDSRFLLCRYWMLLAEQE